MDNKCLGCGATLQTIDPKKIGYVKSDILYSEKEELLCERCFNLKHYNKTVDVFINERQFLTNTDKIKKDGGLVVNIVDIFDFEGTFIPNIRTLFPKNKILLVCNKYDLYLKSTNPNKIRNYVREILKSHNIKVSDIIMCSANKKSDIERLMKKIAFYSEGKNIYFFGMTNVGKSTLINGILNYDSMSDNGIKNNITVSNMVNTTLGFIKIPIDNGTFLVDTPGIINNQQLTYYLDKNTLNYIVPKKFIKPAIYQLNSGQTVFINGFARFDFVEGEKTSFVVNVSNSLKCHRTKLENADSYYDNHKDDLLLMPNPDERARLGKLVKHHYVIPQGVKKDICISGLGYITVSSNDSDAVIDITTFEKIKVIIRDSIV